MVTAWAAVTLNFLIPRLMPGSPAEALLAQYPHLTPQALHALTTLLGGGHHQSLLAQYGDYWKQVFTFNFGISFTTSFGTPVRTMVLSALPWTLGLVGVTTILAFVLGTFIGLVSGWRRGSWLDAILPPVAVIGFALPDFWVGMVLVYVFNVMLGVLPYQDAYNVLDRRSRLELGLHRRRAASRRPPGDDDPRHPDRPLDPVHAQQHDHGALRRLRAHGSGERPEAVADHVGLRRPKRDPPQSDRLRHDARLRRLGLRPRRVRLQLPGLGNLLLRSVEGLDYPVMQALFLLITLAVLFSLLACDVLTAILDPRTREV